MPSLRSSIRPSQVGLLGLALVGTLLVSACSGFGGGALAPTTGLAPGLVAAMDQPGAQLDEGAAYSILNQFRATRGAAPFVPDPALAATAQQLARTYASSNRPPAAPAGMTARFSAGYTTFADTFSGWRSTPQDAAVLASGQRAGLAVVFDPSSSYGTHWVLLIGD